MLGLWLIRNLAQPCQHTPRQFIASQLLFYFCCLEQKLLGQLQKNINFFGSEKFQFDPISQRSISKLWGLSKTVYFIGYFSTKCVDGQPDSFIEIAQEIFARNKHNWLQLEHPWLPLVSLIWDT
jgi:hypothetical protein